MTVTLAEGVIYVEDGDGKCLPSFDFVKLPLQVEDEGEQVWINARHDNGSAAGISLTPADARHLAKLLKKAAKNG
ncbi:hypothetical protein [Mycobacterium sp. E2327]|uniref:hypothetical protein n=1 Tax=Mycobacterium sp. E2327 TaxID=1834132 RepID=UPI001E60CFBB|nr:hypothetical protein [Mycobacterium sp. E2327]